MPKGDDKNAVQLVVFVHYAKLIASKTRPIQGLQIYIVIFFR